MGQDDPSWVSGLLSGAKHGLLAAAASFTLACSAQAGELIKLPIAKDKDIAHIQEVMVEAWNVVDDVFFDSTTLRRVDWPQTLARAMTRAAASESKDSAYTEISAMLSNLGDPYTRIIEPRDYSDYRESSDGEMQGVGLLLSSDPRSHQVVVAAPLADSPAQRAGLQRGDVLVAIDGQPLPEDEDSDSASKKLRGAKGTRVSVSFQRFPSGYTPGVPSAPAKAPLGAGVSSTPLSAGLSAANPASSQLPYLHTVTLERAPVHLSPVAASKVNMRGQPIGYVRLSQFNAAASEDMRAAVDGLLRQGVKGFILDIRDNPGGMVNVGMDIAKIWVPGGTPAFAVAGRDGTVQRTIALPPGPAVTDLPMIVLVNGSSASASEILASALHDAGRAKIVGEETTYGKGRIQAVFDLDDGSALFVTVASYQTPKLADIDHVGIKPDIKCTAPAARVEEDDDIPIAVRAVGVWKDEPLEELLFSDSCFMTAGKALATQVTQPASLPRLPALPAFLVPPSAR